MVSRGMLSPAAGTALLSSLGLQTRQLPDADFSLWLVLNLWPLFPPVLPRCRQGLPVLSHLLLG